MDFANAFALTGWFVAWYLGGVVYSFASALLLLKDNVFQAVLSALWGTVALGSLGASVWFASRLRSWRVAAVVLPLAASFATVFVGGLLAGNGHSGTPAMEPGAIQRFDLAAGGIELAGLAMLAVLLQPNWAALAALACFCATVWYSAMNFAGVLLSHQQM
jgi:hypothetical protein